MPVYLGAIAAGDVWVELYAEPADGATSEVVALSHDGSVPGATSGFFYRGQLLGARPTGDYTVRVVPTHQGVRVPAETALIHWQR